MSGDAPRQPPHNIQAEKALLGAILLNNRVYERVSDFLLPDHFAIEPHRRIFEAIGERIDRGQRVDRIVVQNLFGRDESIAEIGGVAYLGELAESAAPASNAGEYGRIIRDLHLKRQLVTICEGAINGAFFSDDDAKGHIERLEGQLAALEDGDEGTGLRRVGDGIDDTLGVIQEASRNPCQLAGLSTGLVDLDNILGGLSAGELIIMAGATSMGKTALATGIADHVAREQGKPVAFFSIEMLLKHQLNMRFLAAGTGVNLTRLRRGDVGDAEWPQLTAAAGKYRKAPFFVDDTSGINVSAIRSRSRRLKRKHGLSLIVVDYLQLALVGDRYSGKRVDEVTELTRALKGLAKELGVPVLALAQLSRAVDTRENPRPRLSDLRESGSIEQDADTVVFVFREEYYLGRDVPVRKVGEGFETFDRREGAWKDLLEKSRGKAEIIVAKHRMGEPESVMAYFDKDKVSFGNLHKGV